MNPSRRRLLPWALVGLVLPVALLGLVESSPQACSELPGAFSRAVVTEQRETLGVVASHCETTRLEEGDTASKTIVNCSGLVGASALLRGGVAGGRRGGRPHSSQDGSDRHRAALLAGVGALVAFFL